MFKCSFPPDVWLSSFVFWFTVRSSFCSLNFPAASVSALGHAPCRFPRLSDAGFPLPPFFGIFRVALLLICQGAFPVVRILSVNPLFSVTTLIEYHIFILLSIPFLIFFILFSSAKWNKILFSQGGLYITTTICLLSTSFYNFFNSFPTTFSASRLSISGILSSIILQKRIPY